MQAVAGFYPGHRAGVFEQVFADFLAAVGWQAVHEEGVLGGAVEESWGHLIAGEGLSSGFRLFVVA